MSHSVQVGARHKLGPGFAAVLRWRRRGAMAAGAGALLTTVAIAGCGGAPSTGGAASLVRVAKVAVNGSAETVLTDSSGRTLYYNTQDRATKVTCTGGCASLWPALTTSASAVGAPSGVGGNLTVFDGPDGHQVEYNGHPLYTYSGDTGPDQSTGEGVGGIWFVATPSLAGASGASASPSSSGGYAY
ncbi:MAG: hypothetical protein WBU92_09175 [Candidatus Dormiibacterota bacterium]